MLKKLATILMTGALFLAPFQTVNAASNYFVTLDGVRQNVTPIVQSGTTLLPVATVGKLVGYKATWNNKTKSGTLENMPYEVHFKLGSYTLLIKEKESEDTIHMPQPVKVINGKTYLPLRAVGEALGMEVGYNGSTREISLQTRDYSIKQKNASKKHNPKYDNLTLEEWNNLSFDEKQLVTAEQRNKVFDRYADSLLMETEKEKKEEKQQSETTSTLEPKVENKTYSDEEIVEETLRLLNEERERLGLNKLEMRDDLNRFAKWKANYLVEHNIFDHTFEGKSIKDQLNEHNITNLASGAENLTVYSKNDKANPFNMWKNSPGHYKNMTKPNLKFIGFNVSDKGAIAVMILIEEK